MERSRYDFKKFFIGFLITLLSLSVVSTSFMLYVFLNQDLSTEPLLQNLIQSFLGFLMFWFIPAAIGGAMFVKRGKRGLLLTIGATLALVVIVFATCVASLSGL